jgi:hypothetical protein
MAPRDRTASLRWRQNRSPTSRRLRSGEPGFVARRLREKRQPRTAHRFSASFLLLIVIRIFIGISLNQPASENASVARRFLPKPATALVHEATGMLRKHKPEMDCMLQQGLRSPIAPALTAIGYGIELAAANGVTAGAGRRGRLVASA